jgi:hypothetical protein
VLCTLIWHMLIPIDGARGSEVARAPDFGGSDRRGDGMWQLLTGVLLTWKNGIDLKILWWRWWW